MRHLQVAVLSFFFAVLFSGRAHTAYITSYGGNKWFQAAVSKDRIAKVSHRILVKKNPTAQAKPKKYKTKGIGVTVPSVSPRDFVRVGEYHGTLPLFVSDSYASFLYCVDHMRGPPSLS